MNISSLKKLSLCIVLLGLLAGCGGTQHNLRPMKMKQMMQTAEKALDKANDAYSLAQTANITASEASHGASEAQKSAESALACCNDNASRLDKMFEEAMRK